MSNNLAIKIVGPAGFGIKLSGMMVAKTFKRAGLNVFAYTEYPSLIRGGHNTYQIDVSPEPVHSSAAHCDILIGLTKQAILNEKNNIRPGGTIIFDQAIEAQELSNLFKKKINLVELPLVEIAQSSGGELMKNTVALGALMALLNFELKNLNAVIKDAFVGKDDAAANNLKAAQGGYALVKDKKVIFETKLTANGPASDKVLISGNQACALGTIAAGCQVYVAYPMTPSTEILHFLAARQQETGMLVHQPEDEIAGIHVALGASFAGARVASGTSGGGFALMNEGLSLSGMTETPIVIFEVMRPAPATGNPTWSEQGDLLFVVNSGHGEFPKVVITPGLPEQCFDLVQHGFNLAETFQIPVIILSDKHLGESSFTITKDIFDEIDKQMDTKIFKAKSDYKRYELTPTGITPRTIPGVLAGEHVANSDEHDEYGFSDEAAPVRQAQMNKRLKKLDNLKKDLPLPKVYGPQNARTTLVCWGSTLGACLDTAAQSKNINVLHFSYVWPLPKNLDKLLKKFKKLVLVENNKTGQLGALIRQETGIEIKNKILKYDSRPFWTGEIVQELKSI